MQKRKTLLVTDLDDTLWNWFDTWHASFCALLEGVIVTSGVDRGTLESEARLVHQRHGTAEYSNLLQELPSLVARCRTEEIQTMFAEAINASRDARRSTIATFPGVHETLDHVRASGAAVVAFTESQAYWTNWRLRKTGLDGKIDVLYSSPDHELPNGESPSRLRTMPPEHYKLQGTIHRYTPEGTKKPDAAILQKILSDMRTEPADAVYVGDSLMKDVAMAQDAKVLDVWAHFADRDSRYELLRRVTHWTDDDVKRERELSVRDVRPTHEIRSMTDLLDIVEFNRSGTHT